MALAARAGALALQQPATTAAAAPQRSRPRHAPTVARAGKRADEASSASEPAGIPDGLLELIPDPAADDNLLAEDDPLAKLGWGDAYAATGSGSDFEWQSPGAGDPWYLSDYDVGAGGGAGGSGRGGGADLAGAMGSVGDPNFGFDQLKSEDWSDQLVNEVGEGNSFRREQRERYGMPLLNMTNLAHASEEELLVGAEAQALRDDKVDKMMQEAMSLHHSFFENATNRYAVAVRFGELMEEIEYDDWNLPLEGEEQGVPSWCRAAFAMRHEYEELNARAALEDEMRSAAEMQFFEDAVAKHVRTQLDWADMMERGISSREAEDQGKTALERMLDGMLPGTKDEFETKDDDSEALVDDLLTRASKQADAEFFSVLEGALEEDELPAVAAAVEEEEDEEGEEEAVVATTEGEEEGEEDHKQRRKPRLGAAHLHKVQAAAEDRERQKAELTGRDPSWGGRPSDPLLDLLERHDQAS